jgi:membrane protease YdiL (CAAX protease family)
VTASPRSTPWARAVAARPFHEPVVRAVVVMILLGIVVGLRWAVTIGAMVDGVPVGAAFGTLLIAAAVASGWRPARPARAAPGGMLLARLAAGLAAGLVLVGLSLAVRGPGPWVAFDPAGSFAPWAAVTVLVAVAEEVILRGALFEAVEESGGAVLALATTSAAFALLHVPLYGWHVVPLDLGVGLFLGGLRVLTGGVAAPAMAHVVADIATWWM